MRINVNFSLYGKEGELYRTNLVTKADQLGYQITGILQDELETYFNSDEVKSGNVNENALQIFESVGAGATLTIYDLKAVKPGELKMKLSSNTLFNEGVYLDVYVTYSVSEMNRAFLEDIAMGVAGR